MSLRPIKEVCICGGGNLGHAFVADLGSKKHIKVNVLTRRPEGWSKRIVGEDENYDIVEGNIAVMSDNAEEVIPQTDLIIITVPCFAREQVLKAIAPYISNETIVGAMPGGGNFELLARKNLPMQEKSIAVFGSMRIPYICRIKEYGKSVRFFRKPSIQVIVSDSEGYRRLKQFIAIELKMDVIPLNNFLELVLSNSNPILHPSRLMDLFYNDKEYYKSVPFYEEWTDNASSTLVKMDAELFNLIAHIPKNLTGVKPLLEHYECLDAQSLTNKIKSIKAFVGIQSPMIKTGNSWSADYSSRYFTEDIPYGLLLIKSLMILYKLKSPQIDSVIWWIQSKLKLHLITRDGNFDKDAQLFPIFQKYGVNTPSELDRLY